MKPLIALVFIVAAAMAPSALAERLGEVEIVPIAGWTQVDLQAPRQAKIPFPTLRFAPVEGSTASLLISAIPSDFTQVSDLDSLQKFHRIMSTPFCPPNAPNIDVNRFSVPEGFGVYSSFEDPSLIGKPAPKGESKVATTVCLLLARKITLSATIFSDSKTAPEIQQALLIVRSATLRPSAPRPAAPLASAKPGNTLDISQPHLGAVLRLPASGFKPVELSKSNRPGYFSFLGGNGVVLSGWLDKSSGFNGMRTYWAGEKEAFEKGTGFTVKDESLKIVAGWNAVLYTVQTAGPGGQKNIRACRVSGDTWADVHLSAVDPATSWGDLENVLKSLSLSAKQP